ncbi:MAG: hypothetical protein FJZ56_03705 [Chlamydiae bacterium]|nr:hypothetical protein [Chlamydiota bacterium]
MKKTTYAALCISFLMTSCATNTQSGALGGAIGGAAIGGIAGGGKGALIGAAVGTLAGALVGSWMDENGNKQKLKLKDLCEWKNEDGMSESEIKQKLKKSNLQPLTSEQKSYLKDCGFSDGFIRWWQGQSNVGY